MFERYTEKARRTIFFGCYEASQFGSPYIESEYLLLGLLREDKALAHTFLPHGGVESSRKEVEGQTVIPEKVSISVADLPLSNECKRILAYARLIGFRTSTSVLATSF
jgi:ATP-dependent Clp protease ATP-binding subunit ClpC